MDMEVEDKVALSDIINQLLSDCESCSQLLPLDLNNPQDLFHKLQDGFLLCGLVNKISPGTVSERSLHKDVVTAYSEAHVTDSQRAENITSVISTANEKLPQTLLSSSLWQNVELSAEVIMLGSDEEAIISFLWQLVRVYYLKDISVHKYPELVLLLDDDEDMSNLLFMSPDDVIFRWINYHLVKANDYRARRLDDWSNDMKDCHIYSLVLRQLLSSSSSTLGDSEWNTKLDFSYSRRMSDEKKADVILSAAQDMGVQELVLTKEGLLSGHEVMNVIFCGQIFKSISGLSLNQHVREHVKESINELVEMKKEAEEQERLEKERVAREKKEEQELEIAREKEKQFLLLQEEEEKQMKKFNEEMEIAREKERKHREMEAEEARIAAELRKKQQQEEQLKIEKEQEDLKQKQIQMEKEREKSNEKENPPQQDQLTDSSSRVEVVEEVWENQTYIPVRGWGGPRSTVHHFSDLTGAKKISLEQYSVETGWSWLMPDGEWQVDHSSSYGEVDEEGWCYGTSFDKLLDAIRLGTASGENKTTNLVRRRRLLRVRVCNSSQALTEREKHTCYLKTEKLAVEDARTHLQRELELLNKYESDRGIQHQISKETSLMALAAGLECFVEFSEELKKLRTFLVAQAEAEFAYADKLESQHKKYYPSVPTLPLDSDADISRKRSTTTEIVREYLHLNDETNPEVRNISDTMASNVTKASFQFFSGFSEFNLSSANKYRDFGNFITESVLGDVKALLVEVEEATKEAKRYLKFEEENKGLVGNLCQAFTAVQHSYLIGIRKMQIKSKVLSSKIRGDGLISPTSAPSVDRSSGHNDNKDDVASDDHIVELTTRESISERESSAGSSLKFNFNFFSSATTRDSHLCLQSYKSLALDYKERIEKLHLAATKCTSQKNDFSLKIRQSFVVSMQLCCHEKSKICTFNANFMNETSNNFQSWNNAVNEKEFEGRDDEKEVEKIRRKSLSSMQTLDEANHEPENKLPDNDKVLPPIVNGHLVLRDNMKFTTCRDARVINLGSLDGIVPQVITNSLHAKVNFGEKGSWMKMATKGDEGTASSGTSQPQKSSSSGIHSTKSRFVSFFSSKTKGDNASESVVQQRNNVDVSANVTTDVCNMDLSNHEDNVNDRTAHIYESHVVITAEGFLHLYGVPGNAEDTKEEGGDHNIPATVEDVNCKIQDVDYAGLNPLKSLSLEDCHVLFQENDASSHMPFVIEIYPKKHVGGKRVSDGIVLLPCSKVEAQRWLNVLCSPLCGASLMTPIAGVNVEVASYDSVIHSSNGDEVYDLYKMYDPEDVKPELAV